MARGLKQQVGAEHCLVIIDYLQLLPVPDTVARQGDLEADKYRVEIAQQVLDASKDQFDRPQDTVLAISEARKPTSSSQHHTWGTKIEDLLGSARLGYSADGVLLLRPMSDDELQDNYGSIGGDDKIRGQLSDEGISPLMITLAKGRDGMTRGSWPAEFHFQQSSISEGVPNRPGAGPISLPPRRRDAVSVSVQTTWRCSGLGGRIMNETNQPEQNPDTGARGPDFSRTRSRFHPLRHPAGPRVHGHWAHPKPVYGSRGVAVVG